MADSYRADVSGLDDLARKLAKAAEKFRVGVDVSLVAVGEAHKAKAIEALEGHSASIPPTIKVQAIPGAVRLTAAGTALAWSYEKGNKDGVGVHGDKNFFSHPVHAKKGNPRYDDQSKWVEQARYPFFTVARKALRKPSLKLMNEAGKKALTGSGIDVTEI